MGKRKRKNRTHLKGPEQGLEDSKGPKSFVIRSGDVTRSISQLVRDVRKIMEPGTATRLRERQAARLRDYLVMAPALHVTHMMIFTLTEATNVHMRIARLPAGPTLTFRVERYSLMKDLVNASMKNLGKAPGGEYRSPPLLVLNNFQQPPPGQPSKPELRLMTTMFQGLFPAIQVEKSALPTFRRVLLLSYHADTHLISFRHYTISVRPHGVSRRVRKLLSGATSSKPTSSVKSSRKVDLGSTEDIADFLIRRQRGGSSVPSEGTSASTAGYDSTSETDASEAESDSNAVELPDDYLGRGNKKGERKAVRLVEVGPRMELRLIKVVEGLVGSKKGEGETVFHEFVHKSKAESNKLQAAHVARRKEKDERRRQQEANVERKQQAKAAKVVVGEEEEGADDEEEDGDLDVEGLSDVEANANDEDEFEYEDRYGGGGEEADDLDGDAHAGEVSEDDDEVASDASSESEDEPVQKVVKRSVTAGKSKKR